MRWLTLPVGFLGLALSLAGAVVPLTEVTVDRAVVPDEIPYVLKPAYYHDIFSRALPLQENWPVVNGKWVFAFALNMVPCLLLSLLWRSRWAPLPLVANASALMAAFVVVDPANQIGSSELVQAGTSDAYVPISSTIMLVPAGAAFSGLAGLATLVGARWPLGNTDAPRAALAVTLLGSALAVCALFVPLACTEAFHREGPVISVCASYFSDLSGSILPDNWPVEGGRWVVAATALVVSTVVFFASWPSRRWLSAPLVLAAAGLLMAAVVVTWPDDDGDSDTSVPETAWGLVVAPAASVIVVGGVVGWLVRESAFDY